MMPLHLSKRVNLDGKKKAELVREITLGEEPSNTPNKGTIGFGCT